MFYKSLAVLALGSLTASAAPVVTDLVVSQDQNRLVTVGYSLSEEAIVTMEAFTNGVSIGYAPLVNATGDVGVRVAAGTGRRITWYPVDTWPNHRIKDGTFSVRLTAWALDNPPDYLIVDLRATDGDLRWYPVVEAVPGGITNDVYKTDKLAMRHIRASGVRWRMGNSIDNGNSATANVTHEVILTNDYYFGVYKVTEYQHKAIRKDFTVKSNPAFPKNGAYYSDARGVGASYDWPTDRHNVDPNSTCGRLNALTGLEFDLPTDAQWEFAARAGTVNSFLGYSKAGEVGWCNDNSVDWTAHGATGSKGRQKVGLLNPNNFGLYDVFGDGFELCLDKYSADYNGVKRGDLVIEPEGPTSGNGRVLHNGSWDHDAPQSYPMTRCEWPETSTTSYLTYRLACGINMK